VARSCPHRFCNTVNKLPSRTVNLLSRHERLFLPTKCYKERPLQDYFSGRSSCYSRYLNTRTEQLTINHSEQPSGWQMNESSAEKELSKGASRNVRENWTSFLSLSMSSNGCNRIVCYYRPYTSLRYLDYFWLLLI